MNLPELQTYTPAPDLLKERVILVTGAGDGIGRAAATSFAAHGATVILLGRTTAKLEAVYDQIEQAGGPQPAIYPLNLEGASVKDYEDLANTVADAFGRLDGLLHNAAMLGHLTPFEHVEPEIWSQVMQVNLNGPFMLTQACLALLRESTHASVLFSSDRVGRQGRAYWGPYAISKAGVEGMMEVLADELSGEAGIRVNSIDPGPIHTAMRNAAYPAEDKSSLRQAAEIMPWYLYLMGDDSRDLTGQAVSVAEPE